MRNIIIIFSLSFFACFASGTAGEIDSIFLFTPVRPLVDSANLDYVKHHYAGLEIALSNSGFAFGVYYQKEYSKDWSGTLNLIFSGARNTDELEEYVDSIGDYRVPNKIHRLFFFPLSIGIQKRLFSESISESFRPFVCAGLSAAMIISTPYSLDFFSDIGSARYYYRAGYFVGFGSMFGSVKSPIGINIKYYSAPFGGSGLESVSGHPIKTFGGLFISATLGGAL